MKDFKLTYYHSEESLSIYIQSQFFIGSSELSLFNNQFYFNRLFVVKKYRNLGFGSKLMKKTIEIVDSRKKDIILNSNPYGDLNYKQLLKFYTKHGFRMTEEYNTLIKKCLA